MKPSRACFTYSEDPPTIQHQGRTLPLRKLEARLLARLLADEYVSVADMLAVGVSTKNSLRAQLCLLRRHLPSGVRLINVYTKGYHLVFK